MFLILNLIGLAADLDEPLVRIDAVADERNVKHPIPERKFKLFVLLKNFDEGASQFFLFEVEDLTNLICKRSFGSNRTNLAVGRTDRDSIVLENPILKK